MCCSWLGGGNTDRRRPYAASNKCSPCRSRDRQSAVGRRSFVDDLRTKKSERGANAAIFLSKSPAGLAIGLGEWADSERNRGPWVATTHGHLCVSVRMLIALHRLRPLRSESPKFDGSLVESQIEHIRTALKRIPNHAVAMHAAIAAKAVRQAAHVERADIRIWTSDPETLEVRHIRVPVSSAKRIRLGDWTLVVDDMLTARVAELRLKKLPRETGGVLIGAYDLARKIVYIVDTIPSPPDSEEWPTLYIRGSKGLKPQVDRIHEMTGGQLEYVGEWHSHPDGCPTLPSGDDRQVFTWLTEHLSLAGLPALMAIVGEGCSSSWHLGEMITAGGSGAKT